MSFQGTGLSCAEIGMISLGGIWPPNEVRNAEILSSLLDSFV